MDVIQQHALFFDHLVELIPARYYHGDGEERVDLRTMKKAARAAVKQEFKAKFKENKRKKLDPDAPATALEIQQGAKQGKALGAGDGDGATASTPALRGPSLSREELKAKLQSKIEAIQQQRIQEDKQALATQAKEWRQKTLESSATKHKQQQQQEHKAGVKRKPERKPDGEPDNQEQRKQQRAQQPQQKQGAKAAQEPAEDSLQFARIEFDESKPGHGRHQKKPTKDQLLAAAEAKQADLAAATATPDGQVRAVHEAWRTALARAGGEKVLDDPKLLRRSLKKDAKRKEKSTKAWQERKAVQKDQQDRKQQKRTDNLQARVDKKIENKKDKREKKLLRAGFEGRKAGFIGGKGGGGAAPSKPGAASK